VEDVEVLDATAWLAALQSHRPELVAQHVGRIDDPGWQALVIRPQHRAELLGSSATYATVVEREYDAVERVVDLDWAQQQRDAQRAHAPTATLRAAGYPPQAYVGYRVGPEVALRDERGLSYKVFFELEDFRTSLAPDLYLGFSRALEEAGFVGDSKLSLRPGQLRFQYNNVIVHAPSMAMAECAEATGLAYFSGQLLHVARGVDVWADGRGLDWHHFLLTGRFGGLPAEVQAFVQHREPLPPAPCPR
jgi:hypothetical protein